MIEVFKMLIIAVVMVAAFCGGCNVTGYPILGGTCHYAAPKTSYPTSQPAPRVIDVKDAEGNTVGQVILTGNATYGGK